MLALLLREIRNFRTDRRGVVAIVVALVLSGLIGFMALGVDLPEYFFRQRRLQAAADAAAVAATFRQAEGGATEADLIAAAESAFDDNNFPDITCAFGGVTACLIVAPPDNGNYLDDEDSVEVNVDDAADLLFARVFLDSLTLHARAVARADSSSNKCFLSLEPDDSEAVLLENNASLPEGCGIAVNSSSETALVLKNNSEIEGAVSIVGNYEALNSAEITGEVRAGADAVDDPYAGIDIGTVPSCSPTACESNGNSTFNFSPGRYCGGCTLSNNSTVNFASGVYYIDSILEIGNSVEVNGTDVTFVLMDGAVLDLGNNATINLTAPTTGDLAGIAIMSDPDAGFQEQRIHNNVTLNITGALYFPTQKLSLENHANSDSTCTHLIAKQLHITNNVQFANNCDDTGVKPIGSDNITVKLVE